MDWRSFADAMAAWVASNAQIDLGNVNWAGDPIGMLGRPCAELSITRNASGVGTDERRYESAGADKDARLRLCGNRVLTLSIVVRARELMSDGGAYIYCERLRDALGLPSTELIFRSVGVSLIDVAALVNLGRAFQGRSESGAGIDLRLSGALDWLTSERVPTIERVTVGAADGGSTTTIDRVTVSDADGGGSVTIP